jgi:hypothetical protein
MCIDCNCYYCKNGGCDGHHFAHDAIRKYRNGETTWETAVIILVGHENMTKEEAESYLTLHKDDWGEVLPEFKDDQGGTI